jgi:hypothetical protein
MIAGPEAQGYAAKKLTHPMTIAGLETLSPSPRELITNLGDMGFP